MWLQARPLLKDRKNHMQLADPRLNGQFPMSALHRAVAVAAMCLREKANARPTMNEVVLAMNYLTSKKHGRPRSISEGSSIDIGPSETVKTSNRDVVNREQAVAEAKMWGEKWREKRRQSTGGGSDGVDQVVIFRSESQFSSKICCSQYIFIKKTKNKN